MRMVYGMDYYWKVDDLCVFPFMRSSSAGRNAFFVRILVTNSPRLYREVLALSIHRRRPDFEVLLAPPWPLDGKAELFDPHVLVQDADEAGLPPALAQGVVCRVRILVTDCIHAYIELDGTTWELRDVSLDELFAVLEEAEGLARGDGGG
jgi:hypothetical protein